GRIHARVFELGESQVGFVADHQCDALGGRLRPGGQHGENQCKKCNKKRREQATPVLSVRPQSAAGSNGRQGKFSLGCRISFACGCEARSASNLVRRRCYRLPRGASPAKRTASSAALNSALAFCRHSACSALGLLSATMPAPACTCITPSLTSAVRSTM